jgi:hypothetical protein
MARVYVSSTITDLRAERQAVMDWLRAARHQAVDSYLPDSDTVRDSCLADVDTCDLYVLILGHRYGFQPADGNPEGLSITHLEFRRAGQCGIPRIALVRTSIPDVRLSEMENPGRAALVLAFREEVARDVRPAEFSDLQGLIQGLSTGVLSELEKLGKRPDGHRAGDRVLRLAPRPPFLAGREDLLAELDDRLTGTGGSGPRVVALHGLAGAGKTSVALAYAHAHGAGAGIMWQLAAEDPAVLIAGFAELAAALGTREGDPVAAVHGFLAEAGGWLLVFDNAPGPEAVAALLPPLGAGRVLITSRDALWPPGQGMEVPVLDLEVAAGFLVTRTGEADRRAAADVAEAVGGLPLALEQAAAYAEATGISLAGYLALFRQRRADLLARGKVTGYGGTVATTWALAFGQLEQAAPGAAGLLRLLAFCAPEAVPLRLLLQPWPEADGQQLDPQVAPVLVPLLEDELAAADAVVALRRFSLARPAGQGAVSVHRLVQAVTADQMPGPLREAWRQAAAALIEAALPIDAQQPDTWPAFAALLPHVQAGLPPDSDRIESVAAYLGFSGGYAAGREFSRALLDKRARALGPEHRGTLAAGAYLAFWTGRAGDAATARDQYAALLPVIERVLGPEHPYTLMDRSNLARWIGEAGDAATGRDQHVALLPIMERVLGPEHHYTLSARSNFARCIGQAGDAAAARDQYAALLPIREKVLGREHPSTLTTRSNLARWTGQAGDAAGARDQSAALLPIHERVLGPEHPDTLATRDNLAHYTGAAGDATGARDQYAALLPIRERVLGPKHPATTAARRSLAHWAREAGGDANTRAI